jgi:hypothetical protein
MIGAVCIGMLIAAGVMKMCEVGYRISEMIKDVLEMRTGNRAGDQKGLSGDRL